jgi:hypothetical protein
MANAWGELSWNSGQWGDQNNVNVTLSGQELSMPAPGEANYTPGEGWGRFSWGSRSWGVNYQNAIVQQSGFGLTSALNNVGVSAEVNEGWGRLTWGENAWGIAGDVLVTGIGMDVGAGVGSVTATAESDVTGQQLNIGLNSVNAFGLAEVDVTGQGLTLEEGTLDPAPDVMLTGIGLTSSTGTLEGFNEEGWGRTQWGEEVWGASGYWAFGDVTGIQLSVSLNSVIATPNTIVDLTGNGLTVAEGIADPSPDATVVGIGLTAGVAIGSVIEADANVSLTGISLAIAQGQAELDAVTFAVLTGEELAIALENVTAGASAEVDLIGNELTITVNSINVQSWQIINTGNSVTWNDIDTAA